jgi:holo-[acyl-carrier protein] synthase
MIIGTGIDITDVKRIDQAHERWGDKFLHKFLCAEEIEYCLRQSNPAPSIAARFAGKEAISKAFGTGIGGKLNWHDIEIAHQEHGRPVVRLHGKAAGLFSELGGRNVHISLSHNGGQAAALAVLET